MRVYLSGAISFGGTIADPSVIAANRQLFFDAQAVLEELGHDVLNPCKIQGLPTWTWHDWMRPSLHMLLMANAITLLEGWEQSRGARLEWEVARQLDYPVVALS